MITIQVKNIEGKSTLPIAGSQRAAGYDIIAVDDPVIVGESITLEGEFHPLWKRIDYIQYHTALFISPQDESTFANHTREYYHTLIHPRSSIRKYNLVLANSIGLVDNDYRGEILCCFKYIWQPEDFIMEIDKLDQSGAFKFSRILGKLNRDKIYKKGDKIAQLVADKTNPTEYIMVKDLDSTERGTGGFGSTDQKSISQPPAITSESKPHLPPDSDVISGGLVERYAKAGGIPIRKKYGEEVRERDQQ
jgi:dUTP pyrophosphatase